MDSGDDSAFDIGRESGGAIVIDHGAASLVAAFVEDALGGDVGRHIVGVAVDPETAMIELGFEAQGVVNDDFTWQEHHREVIPEGPCLDEVGKRGGDGFAAVEACEVFACVVGDGWGGGGGELLPFLPRGQRIVGELDGLIFAFRDVRERKKG